jgi:hypothetical protein
MKKLIVLVLLPIFFALFGCSKESPVTSNDSNGNSLTDWPVNKKYCVNIKITQHTTGGDIVIVNHSSYFEANGGFSDVLTFSTVNTTTTGYTYSRTVTWMQATGQTAFWDFPNNTQYSRTYLIQPDPPPNNSGTYTTEDYPNFTLGTTYSYKLGIGIITGGGDE